MAEMTVETENFMYIPLSSFIILLVILLTCAARRKKNDPFGAEEQNVDRDIKTEYAIMCFPCLKQKPELNELEPTADLSDQFEYIVEKYTIRKVPLLLANTAEDIIERQQELELAKVPESPPQLAKDEFVNFQVAQEVYNVQRIPPCITVAANAGCPGTKAIKERVKPSDILESMSPIPRPPIKNHNYVVIPTKGSLRSKDIMMTKREITNQYLNNFSSVFVDNLKDQVPKDPEQFPSLSRPYTSTLRNYPIAVNAVRADHVRRSKRSKSQKVAYAFPLEEATEKDEAQEEPSLDSDSVMEQTTDLPESDFQEEEEEEGEVEPDTTNLTEKFKEESERFKEVLNDSDSGGEKEGGLDCVPSPFKTTMKSSSSDTEQQASSETGFQSISTFSHKDHWPHSKNVTYEDIQALDVGYEFTSCEKLGVKPKKTRIHYSYEADKLKESLKQLALGDSKISKKCFPSQDQILSNSGIKQARGTTTKSKVQGRSPDLGLNKFSSNMTPPSETASSKSVITETSFLPKEENENMASSESPIKSPDQSTISITSKSEMSKFRSTNNLEVNTATVIDESVAEISKLYELALPVSQRTGDSSSYGEEGRDTEEQRLKYPSPSKSHSFQESGRLRKKSATEGKDHLPYQITTKKHNRSDEPETETSCSLYSNESSVATSPRCSDPEEGKRATLRWKIVIKHHREDDSSRKHGNVNLKN